MKEGQERKKQIVLNIGVYRKEDPLSTLPAGRIQALLEQARRQSVGLFFFCADDIDCANGMVKATFIEKEKRSTRDVPYPDVVLNEWPAAVEERPEAENELRRRVPFTTHIIHNKLEIYNRLPSSFHHLLLPTERVETFGQLSALIAHYGPVVLKPINGRRGDHICKVAMEQDAYTFQEGTNEQRLTSQQMEQIVDRLLMERKYVVQPYWSVRTVLDEPFDFRIHVQRDDQGCWQLTRVYPRLGPIRSIVSNLSKGGRSPDIDEFMSLQYAGQAAPFQRKLVATAMELAETIDGLYPFLIDELGIDLMMNGEGEIRFLEANTAPETRDHERLRAVRTIGFARYLAETCRGARSSGVPVIGMMSVNDTQEERLREACAYAAKGHEADFFYFYPEHAAFSFPLLKGYRLIRGVWESRYFAFPDVLYDRVKENGNPSFAPVYEKLASIPSTESRSGGSFSKLKLYGIVKGDPVLTQHLIPYMPLSDENAALSFIIEQGTVVIKPSRGSYGNRIVVVQRKKNHFLIRDHAQFHRLDTGEMKQLLLALKRNSDLLLQRFVQSVTKENLPYHIRVLMARNEEGGWSMIEPLPFISSDPDMKVVNHSTSFRYFTKWPLFLEHQFADRRIDMNERITAFALRLSQCIDSNVNERIGEMGVDIGIDQDGRIWLYEANMNKVGSMYRELDFAKIVIPAAKRLANNPNRIREVHKNDEEKVSPT